MTEIDGYGWRPIETAPKDGTYFLAWCEDTDGHGEQCVIALDASASQRGNTSWRVAGVESRLHWVRPTYWQPLPRAPVPA